MHYRQVTALLVLALAACSGGATDVAVSGQRDLVSHSPTTSSTTSTSSSSVLVMPAAAPPAAPVDPAPAPPVTAAPARVAPTTAPPAPPPAEPTAPREAPPPAEPAGAPAGSTVEQIIRQVFGAAGDAAVRVAWCESRHQPDARNGVHVGLFQLSGTYHQPRAARLGYSWDQMTEAEPNARVAYDLYVEQGWRPWSCQP